MSEKPSQEFGTIQDPENEMVDPTHPYGPGGAKKDDGGDVVQNPEKISDPENEMVDPTHPYGPGGAKKDDA